ncbi:MAG: universal stress protein [Thermodesulfobacteriota bacterium]
MSSVQPLRTIVVGTDFSEDATAALGWAEHVAREHGAHLVLVHAAPSEVLPAPEFVPLPAEYYERIHAEARQRLEAIAAEVRQRGLTVDSELVLSLPANGVLDVGARRNADLIVVGTRGQTGWKRALLGSTAARLVRESPCPVLVVHPRDAGEPRPVRTIVVPTDFSEDARVAAEAAARLLGDGDGSRRLELLHAYRVPVEAAHLPAQVLLQAIRDAERAAHESLEALAATLRRPGVTVDVTAREGYPPEVIVEFARTARADLIAMGTHGRSGLGRLLLGSTAERVLPSAPCPVLTVHRPKT